jgi:hypothetical protein
VLGVAAVVLVGCSSAPIRGGPLAEPGVRMGESVLMDPGKTGTYGAETLANHGHEDVVLDRIAFLDRAPGLEIIGPPESPFSTARPGSRSSARSSRTCAPRPASPRW